jgi:aerobic carbon-monoxide dehydrogenase large subunit
MNSSEQFHVIGQRVTRKEDVRLTTGRGQYFGDIRVPGGVLHCVFVRSTHAHAELVSVNVDAAREAPGVVAVFTGEDIKDRLMPLPHPIVVPNLPGKFPKHWPLAVGRVKFNGEPLAVIVATDRYLAEDASELVEVEYADLPYVGSPEEAMRPNATIIHEGWDNNEIFSMSFTGGSTEESVEANINEVQAIIDAAPVVIKRTFKTHRTGVTPLETRGVMASWNEDDGLTCWITTQRPHIDRLALADVLGLSTQQVRVIAPRDQGGGFGTKAPFYRESILIPWLAKTLGRSVRWLESREESLLVVGQERDQRHEVTIAANREGKVLALRARVTADNGDGCMGVYWGFVMPVVGAVTLPSGYDIPKCDIQLRCYVTNKPSLSPSRSFGSFPGRFVIERLMDILARKIGKDPIEVRRLNLVASFPYITTTGCHLDSGDYRKALNSLVSTVNVPGFRTMQKRLREEGRYIGLGFGTGVEMSGIASDVFVQLENQPGYGSATVRIDARGRVQVLEGDAPQGTGHETTFAQVVAEIFGIAVEDVMVQTGDTANTPFASGSLGARGGSYTVSAVVNASRKLRDKMARIFIHDRKLNVMPADIVFEDGFVFPALDRGNRISFADLADRVIMKPVALPAEEQAGLETTDYFEAAKPMFYFGAHACFVEVFPRTGEFKITRYVTCEDAGTVINPLVVEGQIQGGVVQGLSNALLEEFIYDDNGQQLTTTFESYKLATAPDVPHVEVTHSFTPCPHTPLGSRGIGEGVPGPVPGALVNAVCDALDPFDIEINELPLRPDKIWHALGEQFSKSSARSAVAEARAE